ncbi:MAG: DNA-processing protein DprA, partial [Candidatus Omnitrophota bacterium]
MTEFEALITLNFIPDIGGIRLKRLFEYFGNACNILEASEDKLQKIEGITKNIANKIKNLSKNGVVLDKELNLIKKNNIKVLTINDKNYPVSLKAITDPPIVLYVKGQIKTEDLISISLVGSRRASFYGIVTAENLAKELALKKICVVSGMARGIDTASHKGALKAGGRTIAILG